MINVYLTVIVLLNIMNWIPKLFLSILILTALTFCISFLCKEKLFLLSGSILALLVDNDRIIILLTFVKDILVSFAFLRTQLTQVTWRLLTVISCTDSSIVNKLELRRGIFSLCR